MPTKVSLTHQLAEFTKGNIIDSEGNSNGCYNFYDWFCNESSLQRKSIKLFRAVKRFIEYANIDTSKYYVFFKNNCPMRGSLYDDFRICDRESGDVIWNVTPKSGRTRQAEIYGHSNGFNEPIVVADNLSQIYKSGVKI